MRAKPCPKSMPTPKRTFETGGPTGSSPAPTNGSATAPSVFQCPEWIPDERPADVLLRVIREKGWITNLDAKERTGFALNTIVGAANKLLADGVIEAGFVKIPGRGKSIQPQRAYRLKGTA